MPSPLRVILVGCGAVARQFYVPALRGLQTAGLIRVSAIIDPVVSAREAIARSFPKAGQAASLEQTISPAGTLAIIASPAAFHAAQAIAAFERGWHVLSEKPMASSLAETEAMIAAAKRAQRLLSVSLYHRFYPSSRYIRSLCQDWALGPLAHFSLREGGPSRWPSSPSFFDRAQTRGGVLFSQGAHIFDLLGWWLGEPAEVRYADDAMGGLEANAFVQLNYPGGAQGRVHLSRDWATVQQYRFVFERGIVTWEINEANRLTVQLAGAPAAVLGTLVSAQTEPPTPAEPQPLEGTAQCFMLQLRNVIAAIAGEAPLAAPGDEALFSARLLERCYAHRTLVDQPWLTPDEVAHAQEFRHALGVLS